MIRRKGWDTADSGPFVQIIWENVFVLRQQLAGDRTESMEGTGKWGRLAKILGREGSDRSMVGRFYVEVV